MGKVAEVKKIHLRAAMKQLRAYVKKNSGQCLGKKQKDLIFLFAEKTGLVVVGQPEDWLCELWATKENAHVFMQDKSFYLDAEWKQLRRKVFATFGKQCMKCGCQSNLAVDHIKPRSTHPELALDFDNMQVLCGPCNSAKGNRQTTDYR